MWYDKAMMNMDYEAILAQYDKREAEISNMLPHLKKQLPAKEYRMMKAKLDKEIQQMNMRRDIFEKLRQQSIESQDTNAIQV